MGKLVLASASPRRRSLLSQFDVPFDVVVPTVDESGVSGSSPGQLVEALARLKSEAVSLQNRDAVVIAADTVVVLGGDVLGKPRDADDARRMLRLLSDRTHDVYTGVAVACHARGQADSRHDRTSVTFGPLTEADIDAYVQTGEPMDKAGAYGIQGQGSVLVRRIDGCFFNVMGLPLFLLRSMLTPFGVRLL